MLLAAGLVLGGSLAASARPQLRPPAESHKAEKKKEKKEKKKRLRRRRRPSLRVHALARPVDALPPPPLPEPPPPPPPPAARYETVDAMLAGDAPAAAAKVKPAPASARPAPPAPLRRWYAALRLGLSLPRTKLFTGAAAALDLGFVLPTGGPTWLRDHLRLDLGFGWSMQPYQGAVEIAGRGADSSFIQNTTLLALTAGVVFFNSLGPPAWRLSAQAGLAYERLLVRADFESFASPSHAEDDTNGLVVQVGLARALGPGEVVLDLRYQDATADLGVLGTVGSDAMGSLVPSLGYAVRL